MRNCVVTVRFIHKVVVVQLVYLVFQSATKEIKQLTVSTFQKRLAFKTTFTF